MGGNVMDFSQDELMTIKDMFLHYWESYRPEGDEVAIYDRILDKLNPEKSPHESTGKM